MKHLLSIFILLLGISTLFAPYAFPGDEKSAQAILDNLDAVQAMAVANQWKWSQDKITTYVNTREVVFKFSDGKVKRIPLPKEKMVVAVAPYIKRTHG